MLDSGGSRGVEMALIIIKPGALRLNMSTVSCRSSCHFILSFSVPQTIPGCYAQTPDDPLPRVPAERPAKAERTEDSPVYTNLEQQPPVPPRQSRYGPSPQSVVPPIPPRQKVTDNGPSSVRHRRRNFDSASERRVRSIHVYTGVQLNPF